MAEAVIFVGLQGAGKTTLYHVKFAATHAHVSRDVQKTASAEMAIMKECLRTGRSFVVDDTNPTRAARVPFVAAAREAGFRVIAYFFDVPARTAIGRNNHRKDKKAIPVPAIIRTAKHLEQPLEDEGFDEIRVIGP
jgi:predicted kinase